MRAVAQITITSINDTTPSATAPANPYLGQSWTDTSKTPPVTKIWDGSKWTDKIGAVEETVTLHTREIKEHSAKILANEEDIILRVAQKEYNEYKTLVDGELTNARTNMSDALATIATMQGAIALKVEQTDIDTAISGVEIGGRNLATETNNGVANWTWAMQTGNYTREEVVENGIKCCKFTRGAEVQTGWSFIRYSKIGREKYEPNAYYTITFEIESSVDTIMDATIMEENGLNSLIQEVTSIQRTLIAGTWVKCEYLAKTKDVLPESTTQVLYLRGMDSNAGVSYVFRNLKIEKGIMDTDWTPAPEDVDSAITAVDSKFSSYSTTTQMTSAIKLAKDSITNAVASTYTKQSDFNTANEKVSALEIWKKEASQKITDSAIIATVSSTYATKAENTATANVADAAQTIATIAQTTAEQTAIKFEWIVKDGTTSSNFTLTDRVATLLSSQFNIDALTTFKNSAQNGTSTVIDGGAIKANSVTADKIKADSLEAIAAKIGGFNIGGGAIYSGTNSIASTTAGVYLGTNGIRLYQNSNAYVNIQNGILTASGAVIYGALRLNDGLYMRAYEGSSAFYQKALYFKGANNNPNYMYSNVGLYLGVINVGDSIIELKSGLTSHTHSNYSVTSHNHRSLAGTVTITSGNLLLQNNQGLWIKRSGGTNTEVVSVTSADYTLLGSQNSKITVLRGTAVRLGSASGTVVTSDATCKQNIVDIQKKYLDTFMDMKIKEFEYKDNPDKKQIGIIAQEYHEILERHGIDVQRFAGIELPDDSDDIVNKYAVNYSVIHNIHMAVTQRLVQEIRKMSKRISGLETKLSDLKQ